MECESVSMCNITLEPFESQLVKTILNMIWTRIEYEISIL